MPNFTATIGQFTLGSYLRLRYTATGVPLGSVLFSAKLTIKSTETSNSSLLSKIITASPNVGIGQIENIGASGTSVLRFDLPPVDTSLLVDSTESPINCFYWVDITFDTGEVTTLEKGRIFALQGSIHS